MMIKKIIILTLVFSMCILGSVFGADGKEVEKEEIEWGLDIPYTKEDIATLGIDMDKYPLVSSINAVGAEYQTHLYNAYSISFEWILPRRYYSDVTWADVPIVSRLGSSVYSHVFKDYTVYYRNISNICVTSKTDGKYYLSDLTRRVATGIYDLDKDDNPVLNMHYAGTNAYLVGGLMFAECDENGILTGTIFTPNRSWMSSTAMAKTEYSPEFMSIPAVYPSLFENQADALAYLNGADIEPLIVGNLENAENYHDTYPDIDSELGYNTDIPTPNVSVICGLPTYKQLDKALENSLFYKATWTANDSEFFSKYSAGGETYVSEDWTGLQLIIDVRVGDVDGVRRFTNLGYLPDVYEQNSYTVGELRKLLDAPPNTWIGGIFDFFKSDFSDLYEPFMIKFRYASFNKSTKKWYSGEQQVVTIGKDGTTTSTVEHGGDSSDNAVEDTGGKKPDDTWTAGDKENSSGTDSNWTDTDGNVTLKSVLSFLKNFFNAFWNIFPSEIMTLLLWSLGIIIVVGTIRMVV